MMKKTTQTLLLVFSTLLLLVSVTVSAHAQNLVKFACVWNTVTDKGEKLVISLQERSGKSFTGTILGTATSGTLVAR
jgi:hypothetical protein